MVDQLKVINFLQDFGCAKLEHLQILFESKNNNFKNILSTNMVHKKDNIFVHNTKRIDNNMLIALDILCKYKRQNRLSKYYLAYSPVTISFLSNDNLLYHIIIANEENKKAIVKKVNTYSLSLPKADKLILAFTDDSELENIECELPFLYCTYPGYEIINTD